MLKQKSITFLISLVVSSRNSSEFISFCLFCPYSYILFDSIYIFAFVQFFSGFLSICIQNHKSIKFIRITFLYKSIELLWMVYDGSHIEFESVNHFRWEHEITNDVLRSIEHYNFFFISIDLTWHGQWKYLFFLTDAKWKKKETKHNSTKRRRSFFFISF